MPKEKSPDVQAGINAISNWATWTVEPDEQVLKKITDVVLGIAKTHGKSLVKSTICQHWAAGDYRIFGNLTNNKLELLAYGLHTGKDNNTYSVTLPNGKGGTATNTR